MATDQPTPPEPQRNRLKLKSKGFGWEVVTIAFSSFFQKTSYFFTSLILARVLGPEGRGFVSALQVPTQLAVNLSEMGIRQSAAFHIGRRIFPLERIVPTLLLMIPIAGGLGIGASLLYFDYVDIAQDDWLLQAIVVAAIPLSLAASYASGVFLGLQRIAAFRRTTWRPALIRFLLVVLLCLVLNWGVRGAMLATLVAAAVGAIYALMLLSRDAAIRLGYDREVASKLQRRGLSYAASLFVLMLNYKIMILLLTRFGTLTDVGLYAQATIIAELIWQIPSTMSSLLLSRGVNAKQEGEFSKKVLVLARISLLAAILAGAGVAIVAPYFFPLVFGPDFAGSAIICIILLPGVAAFIVFKILNTDLAGRGKPWASMLVMLPVLAINILLGWWLVVRDGAIGAAWASSISYIVATAAYIILYSRMTGIGLEEIVRYRRSDFTLLLSKLPIGR